MQERNSSKYYTYAYLREDGTPYYIGKGCGRRIHHKNKVVKPPSMERRIYLKTNLTEEESFRHEEYMIALYGRKDIGTGILHNRTDGGEGSSGYNHTEEAKDNMSKARKGRKLSKQGIENIRLGLLGRKHSEETKSRIGEGIKNSNRVITWSRQVLVTFPDGTQQIFSSRAEVTRELGIADSPLRKRISSGSLGREVLLGFKFEYVV